MRIAPPPKRAGQAKGTREMSGSLMDVRSAATYLGVSEKCVRARAARRLMPFHHWSGRIVFVRSELQDFFSALSGCTPNEARKNLEVRNG